MFFAAIIDKEGNLIGQFQKDRPFIANAKGMKFMRPLGRGPGDLESVFGVCYRGDDLAIAEHYGKIKIFEKNDGDYQWKESVTREPEANFHYITDLAYYDSKWFMSGESTWRKGDGLEVNYIRVYDSDGSFLTSLVNLPAEKGKSHNLIDNFMRQDGSRLYFLIQDKLEVFIIDAAKAALQRTVTLERPSFYKELPEDAYFRNKSKLTGFEERLVSWRLSYSAITNTILTEHSLVVQLRTMTPRMKRFALLFYDRDDFTLKEIHETDDLLVVNYGPRLYFIRGGMPGIDDDAGEFTVDIYKVREDL
jgi:hypothetical protein